MSENSIWLLMKKKVQQESFPAWTQEAYRPPPSKYTLCCSVSWGVPHPVPNGGGGLPPSSSAWGYPIQSCLRSAQLWPGWSTYLSGDWMGYPPIGDWWEYPLSRKGHGTRHWGTPEKNMGPVDGSIVEMGHLPPRVQTHTCENSTFPIPSECER